MGLELVGTPTSPGAGFGEVVHGVGDRGVLVAPDLSPADVVSLDRDGVAAVATVAGAPLSHAAIILRSHGIPAVSGLGPGVMGIPAGTSVLVDGDAGTVRVSPTTDAIDSARHRQQVARAERDEARRLAGSPAASRDGRAVAVVANVGRPQDARLAVSEGADGVGMLRTEFAFLGRSEPPDEEEQYRAYRAIADAVGERPIVLRTLDLGADVPAWDAPPEPNPALGNRGLRLMLSAAELLDTQLRAVARLREDRPLGVMFPMVTTVDELRRARGCLDAVGRSPEHGGTAHALDVGITVEVPAAAVTAELFAPMVDFFAIGTNDLTQYTLAVDRANAAVAALADGLHPAVLRLIRSVTEAGERYGRTVCVVGELGSDRLAIPVLLGLRVTTLSVRPNAVAAVKQVVRAVDVGAARRLADAALEAESAPAVRALASRYWQQHAWS